MYIAMTPTTSPDLPQYKNHGVFTMCIGMTPTTSPDPPQYKYHGALIMYLTKEPTTRMGTPDVTVFNEGNLEPITMSCASSMCE
jgi:hypothetical protein